MLFINSLSEEEEEEDFSKGVNAFLKASVERRKARIHHEGPYDASHVGIENRLIGCATFKKTFWLVYDLYLNNEFFNILIYEFYKVIDRSI